MPSNSLSVSLPFGFSIVRRAGPATPAALKTVSPMADAIPARPGKLAALVRRAVHFLGDSRLAWATGGQTLPA